MLCIWTLSGLWPVSIFIIANPKLCFMQNQYWTCVGMFSSRTKEGRWEEALGVNSELCTCVEISATEIWGKLEIISSGGGTRYSAWVQNMRNLLHICIYSGDELYIWNYVWHWHSQYCCSKQKFCVTNFAWFMSVKKQKYLNGTAFSIKW